MRTVGPLTARDAPLPILARSMAPRCVSIATRISSVRASMPRFGGGTGDGELGVDLAARCCLCASGGNRGGGRKPLEAGGFSQSCPIERTLAKMPAEHAAQADASCDANALQLNSDERRLHRDGTAVSTAVLHYCRSHICKQHC